MKTFFSIVLIVTLSIYSAAEAVASPAFPGLIKKELPDGSTISVYLKGDERAHWMESEDGYSLMYDSHRNIVYATTDTEGNMVPSSVTVKDVSLRSATEQNFLKDIPKKLKYSSAQINTFKSIWNIVQQSSTTNSGPFRSSAVGTKKAICALISFPDKPLVKTKADFEALLNQVGYSTGGDRGSVHDYYIENSYGQLDLEITVAGPYTVKKSWSYYGQNDSSGSDSTSLIQEFATEAATLAFNDPSINPADYDNDGDGYIDAFHIIYAWYGEEQGGDPSTIWAHEFAVNKPIQFGNKLFYHYSCSPELQGNSGSNITHIGVICHEMGHIFGAPDFYDVDYDDNGGNFIGTGNWDLMGSGNWNNNGACPAHINMYQKIQYGWVTPTTLTQAQAITNMPNSAMNAVAYRYDTSTSGEYYIMENRQKTGFDSYVPGTGLLIYHVSLNQSDITSNTVNNKYPQKMYPVCASATTNPSGTVASYGNINSAGCPFPGTSNNTSFTDYTIPSATSLKGNNTLKPVTNIQQQNSLISFNFMMQDADPVTNFQATVVGQSVQLTWNKPSDDVVSYNIYRNDVLIMTLMGNNNVSYTQNNVGSGSYSYCVTARYNDKESSPVCQEVQVNNSSIDGSLPTVQNLTAQNTNNNKDIELDWQSPFVSDWASIAGALNTNSTVYYPNINQFTSVVRLTVDDLQRFQGSKLTKVRFALKNLQCKYTVKVWLSDIENFPSGDPIVSQAVTNPTSSNNNFEVTLNSPVSLTPDKELWIGVQYELNPMTGVAGIDTGPKVADQDFVYIDQWYSTSDDDDFNWYIAGYMQFDNTFLNAPANTWLQSGTATTTTSATTATPTKYVIYRDNVQIATATQSQYVDTQAPGGDHIYCVSIAYDNGKESEQTCVEATSFNNTAIETVTPEEAINMFPNPVKRGETLTIHCSPDASSTLLLYTISGQLIQQEQITGPVVQKQMNVEPGVYLLKINNNSKSFFQKIIVQ